MYSFMTDALDDGGSKLKLVFQWDCKCETLITISLKGKI